MSPKNTTSGYVWKKALNVTSSDFFLRYNMKVSFMVIRHVFMHVIDLSLLISTYLYISIAASSSSPNSSSFSSSSSSVMSSYVLTVGKKNSRVNWLHSKHQPPGHFKTHFRLLKNYNSNIIDNFPTFVSKHIKQNLYLGKTLSHRETNSMSYQQTAV